MISHTSTQILFTLSVLGLSVSISWLGAIPAALAQIDTGDHVCYFHGSDGQEHNLSALCTGFEADTAKAEPEEINAEPVVDSEPTSEGANAEPAVDSEPTNPVDALRSISPELEAALGDRLPMIENATRLLTAPEPDDD